MNTSSLLSNSTGYFDDLTSKIAGLTQLINEIRVSKSVDRSMYVAKYDLIFKSIKETLKRSMDKEGDIERRLQDNQKHLDNVQQGIQGLREKVKKSRMTFQRNVILFFVPQNLFIDLCLDLSRHWV